MRADHHYSLLIQDSTITNTMTILRFNRNWSPTGLSIAVFLLISATHALTNNTLANQFLGPQNAARSSAKPTPHVRLSPLVWDITLASYAEAYAERRRLDCALVPSNGPYGETLFWGMDGGWTPHQAVQSWVDENNHYDYSSNSCLENGSYCGNYTKIEWSATKRVGCARVNCFEGSGVFMTCNYAPRGNVPGQRPYKS